MISNILKNPSIPLRLRKKFKRLVPKPSDGHTFCAPMFEYQYFGSTGNHQDDKIFLYGMHEPATIRFIRSVLKYQKSQNITPIYADIGTNMGQHLLAISGLAEKSYGFEPWKVVRDIATMQIQKNSISHVEIFPFGLSDCDAHLPYSKPENDNLGTGMFTDNGADILEVRKGDDVFAKVGVMATAMKIDTEGFEDKVLRGLSNTIASSKPVIVFEYSAATRHVMNDVSSFDDLKNIGYKFFGILPSREYPVLTAFNAQKRYENVVAWPYDINPSILDKYLD